MSKKIIVAVFCFLGLFICFRVEQRVYEKGTSTAFQGKDDEADSALSEQAVIENAASQGEDKKVAYLTFDDGPSKNTETVLDVLEENDAVATFFLIGSQITDETKPTLLRMLNNNNAIGIHTYSHKGSEIYCNEDAYLEDFEKCSVAIKDATGVEPKLWRFPWGSANCYVASYLDDVAEKLEAKGYNYVDWNVTAEDSVGTPTEYSIMNNIRKNYKKYNYPVILMHDSSCNELTARLLPQIIKELKEAGYSFDTVDHMENPFQWPRD